MRHSLTVVCTGRRGVMYVELPRLRTVPGNKQSTTSRSCLVIMPLVAAATSCFEGEAHDAVSRAAAAQYPSRTAMDAVFMNHLRIRCEALFSTRLDGSSIRKPNT